MGSCLCCLPHNSPSASPVLSSEHVASYFISSATLEVWPALSLLMSQMRKLRPNRQLAKLIGWAINSLLGTQALELREMDVLQPMPGPRFPFSFPQTCSTIQGQPHRVLSVALSVARRVMPLPFGPHFPLLFCLISHITSILFLKHSSYFKAFAYAAPKA